MPYGPLADAVLLAHAAFVAFVVCGGLLVLRWPRAAWLHLPVVAWGAGIEFTGGVCPLTPLENAMRRRAGGTGYEGGFIEHYLMPVLYPAGLTPERQRWLGALVVAVNLAAYALAIRRARRRRDVAAGTGVASTLSDHGGSTP